jgi:hypothetical protein
MRPAAGCLSDSRQEGQVMGKLSALIVAVAIMAPLPAFAYTEEDANACTPDAFRLCQDAIPDAGRVAQCLARQKAKLSPACTLVFSRPNSAVAERERAGSIDRAKY